MAKKMDLERSVAQLQASEERHRQVEEVLCRQRDRALQYLDNASGIILVIDQEEEVVLINQNGAEILGFPKQDIIGKNWFEHFVPERLRKYSRSTFHRVLNGEIGLFGYLENEVLTRTQGERLISWNSRLVTSEGDVPVSVLVSGEDITEQRKIEDALRSSEKQYRLLYENNPIPMWVYDLDNLSFLSVNEAAVIHYGYSREEFLSMTIKDIRPPEDIPRLLENIAKVSVGLDISGVWRHCKKDGTVIFVEIISHTIIFNGRRAEIVLSNDITERKKTAEALHKIREDLEIRVQKRTSELARANVELTHEIEAHKQAEKLIRASEEKFQAVVDNIAIGVSMISPQMEILALNRQMQEWFPGLDLSKKPVCYRSFNDPARNEKCPYCPTCKTFADGKVHEAVTDTPRGGMIVNYRVRSSPIRDNAGNVIAAVEMVEDITERQKMDRRVKESEQKLRAILDSAVQFIGLMTVDGILIEVNNAALKLIDKKKADVLMRPFWELPWWTHSVELQEKLRQAVKKVAEGDSVCFEATHIAWDGCLHYIDFSLNPIKDASGKVVFMIPEGRDITQRKKAEVLLQESEERYHKIINTITDYIYTVRVENNQAVETVHGLACIAVTGYAAEEFKLNPYLWIEMLYPEDREMIVEWGQRILKNEKVGPIEHRIIRKDKQVRWIRNSPVFHYNSDGVLIAYDGVVQDITDYKNVQQERLRAQALSIILEGVLNPILVHDMEGNVVKFNKALTEMFGYKEEIIGRSAVDLVVASDQPKVRQSINECIQKGYLKDLEVTVLTTDNRQIPVLVNAAMFKDLQGNLSGSIAVVTEISLRKKMEQDLIASERRFRRLFEAAQDGILIINFDSGLIEEVNPYLLNLLGYARQEIVDKQLWQIGFIKESVLTNSGFRELQNRGYIRYDNIPLQAKDGHKVEVEFVSNVYEVNQKKVIQCNIRDISVRRDMERAMKQALQIKSDFTTTVSHELRTPLSAIKEGIAIVLDGTTGELNAEQKDFLNTAKINVDRLTRLINDLLDFEKLGSGKMVSKMEENDINAVVREVCVSLAPLAKEKGLDLVCILDEGLGLIKFDRDMITQVMMNLVGNAIKFTENGKIEIRSSIGDNLVQVSVEDTGQGIRQEDMPKLFQMFEQLDLTIKKRSGGTGLGLAISREIIEQHNGKIWVESNFGKGSIFYFILPLKERRE